MWRLRLLSDRRTIGLMLLIVWPLLVAVLGALIYAFAARPDLKEIGRLMCFSGIFWTVYLLTGSQFRIGR